METLLTTLAFITLTILATYFLLRAVHARKFLVAQKLWNEDLQKNYVKSELLTGLQNQLETKASDCLTLNSEKVRLESTVEHLREKISDQSNDTERRQAEMRTEFENLANRILEEKSEKFTRINHKAIDDLLQPVRQKFTEFEKSVQETYVKGAKDNAGMKEQIAQMMQLNTRLGNEAQNLTKALKGDSQLQGQWGEVQLEKILQNAGLKKGEHYSRQETVVTDEGPQSRLDFLVKLPDDKHLIIDSKVTLVHFERYMSCDDPSKKAIYLKAHVKSVHEHIRSLSDKNYGSSLGINCPDYVLMFCPLEHAFLLAVQEDPKLYDTALQKNIAIVSPSTLMATMRTVSYIWKQEAQARNSQEIARQAGSLFDKVVAFVEDMEKVGNRLRSVQDGYDSAMNKLSTGVRHGDTIIGRIEKLQDLGVSTKKELPAHLKAV